MVFLLPVTLFILFMFLLIELITVISLKALFVFHLDKQLPIFQCYDFVSEVVTPVFLVLDCSLSP